MNKRKKIKILVSGLIMSLVFVVAGCGCKQTVQKYKVDLEVWGVLDNPDAYGDIFANYRKINANVGNIVYKKQRIETYQKDLIDAMASGQGPDLFMIHNDWIANFSNKIVAAPKDVLTEQKFRKDFVDVCVNDFVSKGDIFAAPLSVNSLALFYNKDLFNVAGIVSPPKTWEEFTADAVKLTKIDTFGEIKQSGAAMGTAYNINRSTDILNLLMFQNGLTMVDAQGRLTFATDSKAKAVLEFYTQFAKINATNYVWNPTLHYSVDAFSEGTLAMMLNYSWQIDAIKSKSPKLSFAVSSVPQVSDAATANYANYWAYAVSKNKVSEDKAITNDLRTKEAWKLLTYMTTKREAAAASATAPAGGLGQTSDPNFDPAKSYLEKTNQPAARRDLIEKQKTDPVLGVFAQSNLVAKDWYQSDPALVETVFAEMIDSVNKGLKSSYDAMSDAGRKLSNLNK